MPAFTFGPPLNIQPNIVTGPTDNLERQLRLAQIKNLQNEGDYRTGDLALKRSQLEQAERFQTGELGSRADALAEETRFHTGTLGVETDKNSLAKEALAASVQEHKDNYNTQLTDTILRSLPSYGIKPDEAADVLKRLGHPEVADSLNAVHEKDLDAQAVQAQNAISSGQLKMEQVKPELRSRIQATTSGTQPTPTPTPTALQVAAAAPIQSREALRPITPLSTIPNTLGIKWNNPFSQYSAGYTPPKWTPTQPAPTLAGP